MKSSALTISTVCWTGRVLALGTFLFWGAFFVEHLWDWFLHPSKGFPPIWVWLAQFAHMVTLLGLAALWRWPVAGSILTILGSLGFFGGLAISQAASGRPYVAFLAYLAVTIVPVLLTLAAWLARTQFVVGARSG
jgi:hypothetical protein